MSYCVLCPCKAMRMTFKGAPLKQGYCHCKSCQFFSQQDAYPMMIWSDDDMKIEAGEDQIERFVLRDPGLHRCFCKVC